jgi:hypothetical protein
MRLSDHILTECDTDRDIGGIFTSMRMYDRISAREDNSTLGAWVIMPLWYVPMPPR